MRGTLRAVGCMPLFGAAWKVSCFGYRINESRAAPPSNIPGGSTLPTQAQI
jgi:hypothetical protein